MRNCPRCLNTAVIEDGYCGHCRECTMAPLVNGGAAVAVQRDCSTALPPLAGELKAILGMMIFQTGGLGRRLNQLGIYEVPRKAEEEQAAALHWMINLWIKHGDNWRVEGEKILKGEAQ